MKRKIYTLGIAFLSVLGVSCSEWMDVRPVTEIEADELFSTEEGFKNALTGIYVRMTDQNLYGNQLTFNLLEELAQRYDAGARYSSLDDNARARLYNYEEDVEVGNLGATKDRLSNIWNAMYKDIVNINSLLEHLEDNGQEVITTGGLFNLMKGEALALRAFHYFDLLRMWGPTDMLNNGSQPTVPYRTKVGREQIAPMSADSLVIMIEADLLQADSLLQNDPCTWGVNNDNAFYSYRQHRLNKWAVRALMVRFYLYANQPELAAQYAEDVIDHCGRSLVTDMKDDHALFNESLFTLYYENMQSDLQSFFDVDIRNDSQTQKLLSRSNWEFTFDINGEGANDIRGRSEQGILASSDVYMSRKFLCIENSEYDYKVPLIRLAEMYYILAETRTGSEAASYYNTVRNSRGVASIYNITSFANDRDKLDRLTEEYSKEFFGEGQYFFFLKRRQVTSLNVGFNQTGRFPMQLSFYEFEIPDAEKEYGLVPETTEN